VAKKTMFAGFEPNSRAQGQRRHIVAVVAFDGVVLSDLATPCDIFGRVRDSQGRFPYEVRVCSSGRKIRSEHLSLDVPWRLASVQRAGTVVVPGIDPIDRPVPQELIRALEGAIARRVRVASTCSGDFLLARTGALNGLEATTHWRAAEELARRYSEDQGEPRRALCGQWQDSHVGRRRCRIGLVPPLGSMRSWCGDCYPNRSAGRHATGTRWRAGPIYRL